MNGKFLVQHLKKLGCPLPGNFNDSSCDWLLEEESIAAFFTWFCDNFDSNNLITEDEFSSFDLLQKSSHAVLDEEHLSGVLDELNSSSQPDESEDEIRNQISNYENRLLLLNRKKKSLQKKKDSLNLHLYNLVGDSDEIEKISAGCNSALQQKENDLKTANENMNACLDQIDSAVAEATDLYESPDLSTHTGSSNDNEIFLSCLDLNKFFKAEESYVTQLASFSKAIFFKGIGSIPGSDEDCSYQLLDPSKGETDETLPSLSNYKENSQQLRRLQDALPKTEALRINAAIENASLHGFIKAVDDQLRLLHDSADLNLIQTLENAKLSWNRAKNNLIFYTDEVIPPLIKENSMLQISKILTGDFDLKLARQNYFISNQIKVIDKLLLQRSYQDLMHALFNLETKYHEKTNALLETLKQTLVKDQQLLDNRLAMLSEASSFSIRQKQDTIDIRDSFLTSLYTVLSQKDLPPIFISYKNLQEEAHKLHEKIANLARLKENGQKDNFKIIEKLSNEINILENILFINFQCGGNPELSPQPITENIRQLTSLDAQLEENVMRITAEVNKHKEKLKADPDLNTERQLFIYFHNEPEKLKNLVKEFSSKVQYTTKIK